MTTEETRLEYLKLASGLPWLNDAAQMVEAAKAFEAYVNGSKPKWLDLSQEEADLELLKVSPKTREALAGRN